MAQAKPKVAFMFWAPGTDPIKHRAVISSSIDLIVVGVSDYDQAVEVAKDLAKEGVAGIELCAGFANIGVAMVAEAVKGIPVGVVRFDNHPLLDNKTGDQLLGLTP
ncbi:MAG: hypothetical protein J7K77_01320 [Dehalococcoidales bacterium]|nr:hypothetical protein [Dehalococcoidales bacterium]